jgi:glycosyltransferase involved in cell wall biosynthesis
VAGRVKDPGCAAYWAEIERLIEDLQLESYVRKEIRYIPDGDVGALFRAADVSVLPYRRVYQSGVVALSYAQGVPVIASDIDALKADVVEGATGLSFRSGDARDLAGAIRAYFSDDAFEDRDAASRRVREHAARRFSWAANVELTCAIYARLSRTAATARLERA